MHHTIYRIALREPFLAKPRELTSTSRAGLLRQIRLRVSFLEAEYAKVRLPAILNTCLFILLAALDVISLFFSLDTAAILIWIIATVILLLVSILYRKYSPIGQISLAHVYYCWRCLAIWRIELAERCAADER